jgi:hypothetical protein
MTHDSPFTAWLDDFLATYYQRHPVNATFIGVHDYDDRLPDLSSQGLADYAAEIDTFLQRLDELPDEPLTSSEVLDRQLVRGFLEIQRWELGSRHFQRGNPSLYIGEAVFAVIALFLRPFAPLEQRSAAAIARMEALPTFLAHGQDNVREAPLAWTERALRECTGALAFFGEGIDTLIQHHAIADARLREAADVATRAVVEFQHYLDAELRHHTTDAVACGADAFALLLRSGHFLQQDADEIEAAAQAEFERSAAYLAEHAGDFGATSWQDVLAQLADIHPLLEQYYARYGELWDACKATTLQHDLLTWPDFPLRYVPQPEWARSAAPHLYFLFYRAPAAFDQTPITDYLVTPITDDMPTDEQQRRLRATNESVIKLNHVVHHGAIGHHVQNWHAMRSPSRIGQIAGVDCSSRIAMFCGGTMTEGWACYTTELMAEVGFLTPLEHYAERHSRLRMAARALVDIRLHRGDYSLQDAAAFYRDQVGMNDSAAIGEAVKNSMFPATATMYLVGTDLIHALRHELAAQQGAKFNLRQFHDRLLSFGSIPVTLMSEMMRSEALQITSATQGGSTATQLV